MVVRGTNPGAVGPTRAEPGRSASSRRWTVAALAIGAALLLSTLALVAYTVPRAYRPHSTEEWTAQVNGTGPWRVGLPFPVSPLATTFDAWMRNLTVSSGATVRPETTSRGAVVLVEGSGNVTLRSSSVQYPMSGNRCCAQDFMHSAWTTLANGSGPVTFLWIWTPDGPVSVDLAYTGGSETCGRFAEFSGPAAGGGWARISGHDERICT